MNVEGGKKSHVVPPLDKELQATNECSEVELAFPRDLPPNWLYMHKQPKQTQWVIFIYLCMHIHM